MDYSCKQSELKLTIVKESFILQLIYNILITIKVHKLSTISIFVPHISFKSKFKKEGGDERGREKRREGKNQESSLLRQAER